MTNHMTYIHTVRGIVCMQVDYSQVLGHTLGILRQKYEYFEKNVEEMDELFEASFSSVAETGRLFSKCGQCRHYMKYIASRPQRLYCMTCDQTYSLPLAGSVKLYKVHGINSSISCNYGSTSFALQELKCPLDDFEILLFVSHNGKKVRA